MFFSQFCELLSCAVCIYNTDMEFLYFDYFAVFRIAVPEYGRRIKRSFGKIRSFSEKDICTFEERQSGAMKDPPGKKN